MNVSSAMAQKRWTMKKFLTIALGSMLLVGIAVTPALAKKHHKKHHKSHQHAAKKNAPA